MEGLLAWPDAELHASPQSLELARLGGRFKMIGAFEIIEKALD